MEAKTFLRVLILCELFLMVISTLPGKNLKESPNLQIRKKRVVDTSPNKREPETLIQIPYIVSIHENGIPSCAGSILSTTVIITAAHCLDDSTAHYSIWSDTINGVSGIVHRITEMIKHPNFHLNSLANDLALIRIDPPINWATSFNRKIKLFNGTLPHNAMGTISGWGCRSLRNSKIRQTKLLQSITVPIIQEARCRDVYKYFYEITNKEICTLDVSGHKGCTHGDSGGPLTVDGYLLGVVAWSKRKFSLHNPDVSMNLLHPTYRNWIYAKVLLAN